MGTLFQDFSGAVAAVLLLAENRLLSEAQLLILAKKDDIQVVGAGSYGHNMFKQIVSANFRLVSAARRADPICGAQVCDSYRKG
jgi:hypothetical protein